jgi:hypothetical protein
MGNRGQVAVVLVALTAALAACGDDDKRVSDAKIVDKLNLEEVEGQKDYAIDGDLFCSVARELLNTRSEVEDALEDDEIGLVVASREGNVGIVGVPVFANDCQSSARKKLSKLDPEPRD